MVTRIGAQHIVVQLDIARHAARRRRPADQAGIRLAHPELAAIERERAAADLQIGVVEGLGAAIHDRGERAHRAGAEGAEQGGEQDRHGQELPGGDAGGARDHELGRAREPPEGENAAEQDREGQDLQQCPGHAQKFHLDDDAETGMRRGRGFPQQFQKIEQRDQGRQGGQHEQDGDGELPPEIDRQG